MIWEVVRETGEIAGSFGHGGHQVGRFHWVHVVDLDSSGNYYGGETVLGKRAEKFALQSASPSDAGGPQGGAPR